MIAKLVAFMLLVSIVQCDEIVLTVYQYKDSNCKTPFKSPNISGKVNFALLPSGIDTSDNGYMLGPQSLPINKNISGNVGLFCNKDFSLTVVPHGNIENDNGTCSANYLKAIENNMGEGSSHFSDYAQYSWTGDCVDQSASGSSQPSKSKQNGTQNKNAKSEPPKEDKSPLKDNEVKVRMESFTDAACDNSFIPEGEEESSLTLRFTLDKEDEKTKTKLTCESNEKLVLFVDGKEQLRSVQEECVKTTNPESKETVYLFISWAGACSGLPQEIIDAPTPAPVIDPKNPNAPPKAQKRPRSDDPINKKAMEKFIANGGKAPTPGATANNTPEGGANGKTIDDGKKITIHTFKVYSDNECKNSVDGGKSDSPEITLGQGGFSCEEGNILIFPGIGKVKNGDCTKTSPVSYILGWSGACGGTMAPAMMWGLIGGGVGILVLGGLGFWYWKRSKQ